ncbi:MAG: tetratricopeptide repeat protein [Candidatus Gastranaerophilales bacterium]|nr:tetratricopeptide repeat protein [Candidatus Gastranaerophilales bacterium]
MNSIQKAIEAYQNNDFELAESICLAPINIEHSFDDVADILAAIYINKKDLKILKDKSTFYLPLIRKIAVNCYKLNLNETSKIFFEKALQLDVKDYVACNYLGLIAELLSNYKEAEKFYQKAIEITPDYNPIYNIGVLYRKTGDIDSSIKYLERACELQPVSKTAHYSLGMSYLMKKDFYKGYEHFIKREFREKSKLKNVIFKLEQKSHKDKTILIYCDAGLGDAIMFSRYFPYLKQHFEEIIVYARRELINLFQYSFKDLIFVDDIKDINYDCSVLAMNLPYLLNMDFAQTPTDFYLKSDENKENIYKNKFFNSDKLKVGIVAYAGGQSQRTQKFRTIGFEKFSFLKDFSNMEKYSFQKFDFAPTPILPTYLTDIGNTFFNFSDTAAALKNIDLLISTDTATAHLAGALGIKTFLLLPNCYDWRWFDGSKATLWYKNTQLFVQTETENWSDVIEQIKTELNKMAN